VTASRPLRAPAFVLIAVLLAIVLLCASGRQLAAQLDAFSYDRAKRGRGEVSLRVLPSVVHVTQRPAQYVSFDLLVASRSADTLELDRLTLQIFDSAGGLAYEQYAAGNGGVDVVLPNPVLPPGAERLLFNPFPAFEPAMPLARLRVRVDFERRGPGDPVTASAEIRPVRYRQATRLRLPLAERALVPSGGGFLSHHRRLDYTQALPRRLGITSNFMRYALDFVVVDSLGAKFQGGGTRNEDWYGYGAPVLAPAAGQVVAAHDGQPDNDEVGSENRFDQSSVLRDPMLLYGNYVVLDHGRGEFSVLGHLKNGSVAVRPGAPVAKGTVIGRVGSSGSSINPHLHYELRTGPGVRGVDGLPAHFEGFRRVYGLAQVAVDWGMVDSGDIVEPE